MTRWALFSIACVMLLNSRVLAAGPKAITDADAVLAIYNEDWGLASVGEPQLIFCLWEDGTVVWSEDQLKGGAPFKTAKLPPEALSKTLKRFDDRGAFDLPVKNRSHWGPDSRFTKIVVRGTGIQFELESWHELSEAGGKAIADAHGLRGLEAGEKLIPALATQPAEYLHFRLVWLEVRLAAANLIPKSGAPVTGTATMHAGKLTWRPEVE